MVEHRSYQMILRIMFICLFLVLCGLILYFIYGVFIPAVKHQIIESQDPLFAEVELNYVGNSEPEIKTTANRAVIEINSKISESDNRLEYNGIKSCSLFNSIYDTPNEYSNVCIGFGDCVKVCPQDAIRIENNVAVLTKNCCGCEKCLTVCPKQIIKMVPKESVENSLSEQKYFKFWKSCYRIFHK